MHEDTNLALFKDKDQIERLTILVFRPSPIVCTNITNAYYLGSSVDCHSIDRIKKILPNLPANLTHFVVHSLLREESERENLLKIMADNETLVKFKVTGEDNSFCWKFEEITDENKRQKYEERFKAMKVAPAEPEPIERAAVTEEPDDEQTILGKRGRFVPDSSGSDNPNKKSKL